MSCIIRLDLAECSGLTPGLLVAVLSSSPGLQDLDVSGCKDLAGGQHNNAHLDPLLQPPDVTFGDVRGAVGDVRGGASPKAESDFGIWESPLRSALLALPGAKPRLRRLAVGWGFDGIALRLILEHSSDSLMTIEVSPYDRPGRRNVCFIFLYYAQ